MALPITALPLWTAVNGISSAVAVHDAPGRGLGVFAATTTAPLLTIPPALVLSASSVEEHAKADADFRQLLDAVGLRTPRIDILLFLLAQHLRSLPHPPHKRLPTPTPWAEYIRFLPPTVPLPTLWPASSTALLRGTTLAPAVGAKLRTLEAEFFAIQRATRLLPFWDDLLWQSDDDENTSDDGNIHDGNNTQTTFSLPGWALLDAWFRSRSLTLPGLGTCMVPVLDMANHSSTPNAYFELSSNGSVILALRPGCALAEGDEVTISYGDDKSSAEMLFSYGFIDSEKENVSVSVPVAEMVLDDPLAKAKMHVFPTSPVLTLTSSSSSLSPLTWTCPFAHIAVLNHEDGISFQILRSTATDGYQDDLRVFWNDVDVTDRAADFAPLVSGHELEPVFRLRVCVALAEIVRGRIEEMDVDNEAEGEEDERGVWTERLRKEERGLLEAGAGVLEKEAEGLMGDERVLAYLAAQQGGEEGVEEGEGDGVEEGEDGESDDNDEFA